MNKKFKINFQCPNCSHETIDEVMENVIQFSQIVSIYTEDGNPYAEIDQGDSVYELSENDTERHFQCAECQMDIEHSDGSLVDSDAALFGWLQERGMITEAEGDQNSSMNIGQAPFPHIPMIEIPISDSPEWVRNAQKVIEIANNMIRGMCQSLYGKNFQPPLIVLTDNNIVVPAYHPIAECLIRSVIEFSSCNVALALLICLELNDRIDGFDSIKFSHTIAGEMASRASADPNA